MSEQQAMAIGCEFLVCRDPSTSPFPDDLQDECADCGCTLSFRPYLAAESPKVCMACFAVRKDVAFASRKSDF